MKRIFFSLLFVATALMANAFVNKYNIVGKIDGGVEMPCSGTISLRGDKSSSGLVSYSSLTIYINDMVNYEWSLRYKNIIDETTVEMTNTIQSYKLQMQQKDDSTYIFTLPLFYGSKQGTVRYKAVEQKAKEEASYMRGLFGSGSGSAASKNPVGAGSGRSNGASWSLAGRSLSGSLSKPAYGSNAEGIVVVAIRVDQNGNVVSATKGAGTNTSDQALIQAAIDAAMKAKFTAGDGVAVGSITFVFKLN